MPLRQVSVLCLAVVALSSGTSVRSDEAKKRTFEFTYGATVTGLKPGQHARIWLPVPHDSPEQEVTSLGGKVPPGGQTTEEKEYGNAIYHVEAVADRAGTISLEMSYRVTRHEVRGGRKEKKDDARLVERFLKPDARVPIDGKPLTLLKDKDVPKDSEAAARLLYDLVNGHMKYDKSGAGWGNGDAVWACDSKHGNCTDFHSLFISLARSRKIPAKFEIGFSLPPKRGSGPIEGYHCWAFFRAEGGGWIPVDISEANKNPKMKDYYFGNLTEDRIALSTGRDLTLVPKQDGPPLNFFIFPYVEVEKKPYPRDMIKTTISYRDIK
jgi:transglutaminase-like putative cysteine protease